MPTASRENDANSVFVNARLSTIYVVALIRFRVKFYIVDDYLRFLRVFLRD